MSRNLSSKTVRITLMWLFICGAWLLVLAVLALLNVPFERVKFLVLGSLCYFLGDTIDQIFSLSRNIVARINRRQADGKAKRKAKRDSERLALYRDWPPDLVDTFLEWEGIDFSRPFGWNRHKYALTAPKGYTHWKNGVSYADHLAQPLEFVVYRYRL